MAVEEIKRAVKEILEKIEERENLYGGTWRQIPVTDLIAVARVKTYRATTMVERGEREKLVDDLVDAAAYIVFAIVKVKGEGV